MKLNVVLVFKVTELRHKQCEVVTPHFSTGKNLLKKNIATRYILTQTIEKSFLIDPLNTNNAICCDSLNLMIQEFCLTIHAFKAVNANLSNFDILISFTKF